MFVRKFKYEQACRDRDRYSMMYSQSLRDHRNTLEEYKDLVRQWNMLVDVVQEAGGVDVLRAIIDKKDDAIIDADMLRKMINLCHPDKHDGKAVASEVTDYLLKLRR